MKKLFPLLLSFILLFSSVPSVHAAESMENFNKTNTYTQKFTDVSQSSWYAENVATVYELGLVNGKSETEFVPEGNITIAESITLATRIHNTYCGTNYAFASSSPWYQTYVDYATENDIIKTGQFENFDNLATRSDFATIMANSLPKKEFNVINNIVHGNIPDLYAYMPCAESVYTLYNAGILSGSDEYGTFFPYSNIKRSEVAAIIARIALRSQRKEFILKSDDGQRRTEETVCIKKDAPSNIANIYINPKTGKETPHDTYCSSTEYFEINSTDTIFARIINAATYFPNIIFYDSNKNYISGYVKVVQGEDRIKYKNMSGVFYKVPENAKYVRYCYGSGFHNNNLEIYIITHSVESVKPLEGMKIVNFGDSIFGNYSAPNDISSNVSNLTGATVYNVGFGGCRMSTHVENWDAFSMDSLTDAITTGNFDAQDYALENQSNLPSNFDAKVEMLKSLDFNDVDIITIAYGANDFNGIYLDNSLNKCDREKFAGALRYSIETIQKTYPNIEIVLWTPIYRYWVNDSGEFLEDTDTKIAWTNLSTLDYVNKVKSVGAEYNLLVIDAYNESGINAATRTQYFNNDPAHPNNAGIQALAKLMANELLNTYSSN